MKLAAVVPALFVLISLCGSPVPAPPGSVSGVAFYDANRNGIHDSCDRPLALATVVATAADGKAETSTSGPDGTFHIEKVDPGLALVTLAAPDGELWRSTTATADGTPGAAVEMKDLRDSGGVEIGATSTSPMSATQISVSGVIFNDANGNGQIDEDECGIPSASAYIKPIGATDGSPINKSPGDGTYFLFGLHSLATIHPTLKEQGWVPTTGGDPALRASRRLPGTAPPSTKRTSASRGATCPAPSPAQSSTTRTRTAFATPARQACPGFACRSSPTAPTVDRTRPATQLPIQPEGSSSTASSPEAIRSRSS